MGNLEPRPHTNLPGLACIVVLCVFLIILFFFFLHFIKIKNIFTASYKLKFY